MDNKKRKWIFLRGLVRWKAHWGDFPLQFQKLFPNDEILFLDLPGFGDFYQEKCPRTMEEVIKHLDKRVDWGKGPYHILAFSLGAMVASTWAQKRSQHIQKMFLLNTSDKRSPFYERFRIMNFWLLLSRLIWPKAEFVETGILNTISNFPDIQARYKNQFIQAFQKTPFNRQSFLRQIRMASKAIFPEKAPVPTVFLNSTADRLVSYRCTERIAQHWGSYLETHKQAGHDLTLDDPEWVLKKIQTHLSE